MIPNRQRTIAKTVCCQGTGLHSGKAVNMTIEPAPVNHGIKFLRTDLPESPCISAHFNMVVDTSLATVIGYDGYIVSTIEHLMAAFAGLSIDNILIKLDAHEVPIMDGSAGPFTDMIRRAGIETQKADKFFFVVKEPIELKQNGKAVSVYPDSCCKITCKIDYDHPLLQDQHFTLNLSDEAFIRDVAYARTFGFLHEVEQLKRFGLARGGSLENAIVLDGHSIVNDGGLRFTNEFVRHKVLDCIGDFSLLGIPIMGHIVAEKSGHAFNHAFLRQFFARKQSWETRTHQELEAATLAGAKALAI